MTRTRPDARRQTSPRQSAASPRLRNRADRLERGERSAEGGAERRPGGAKSTTGTSPSAPGPLFHMPRSVEPAVPTHGRLVLAPLARKFLRASAPYIHQDAQHSHRATPIPHNSGAATKV